MLRFAPHRPRSGLPGRPSLLPLLVLLVLLVPAAWLTTSCGPDPDALKTGTPDVLFITFDTLRADAVGAWGGERARTPVLDSLAARGLRFTEATTPFPRTTPAIASLFSGLVPAHHGSREVNDPMDVTVPILSDVLARRGYVSLGAVGNRAAISGEKFQASFERLGAGKPRTDASTITSQMLGMVAEQDTETPLLMWAHYVDPHFPYTVPSQFIVGDIGRCIELEEVWRTGSQGDVYRNHGGAAEEALASCLDHYRSVVAFADSEVGRLLDGLRALGRDPDEALVIFTSDHGEHFGEDGLYYTHGPRVHDAVLRVPLAFAGPGIRRGVDGGTARLEDVVPTVLSLLGVPEEERPPTDGIDLSPRLLLGSDASGAPGAPGASDLVSVAESGSSLQERCFHSLSSGHLGGRHCVNRGRWSYCARPGEPYQLYDHENDPALSRPVTSSHPEVAEEMSAVLESWPPQQARWRSARTPRFKLVERPSAAGGYSASLYDLEADPYETRDVKDLHPDVVADLRRSIEHWVPEPPTVEDATLGDDELEQLRQLGYIE